jgi:putative membrane protein
MHDGMGWWMLWGSLIWVVFLVAVGLIVVWVVRQTQAPRPAAPDEGRERPLEIAQRRYAAGEISREEYEQIRRDLE